MVKAIIPCCGLGTRMSMPLDQSKEMLLEDDKPLIQYSLDLCKQYDLEPLVLTRAEKTDLTKYLEVNNIKYIIMKPGKEWAETVYNSQEHWANHNILLLPDTRFEPSIVINQIKEALKFGAQACFAIHQVEDISQWGFVTKYIYCEKPKIKTSGTAWGVIGFTKAAGCDIFYNMQTKSIYNEHRYPVNFVFLNSFIDVTRTGKIE